MRRDADDVLPHLLVAAAVQDERDLHVGADLGQEIIPPLVIATVLGLRVYRWDYGLWALTLTSLRLIAVKDANLGPAD